jgi:hypothetical protein
MTCKDHRLADNIPFFGPTPHAAGLLALVLLGGCGRGEAQSRTTAAPAVPARSAALPPGVAVTLDSARMSRFASTVVTRRSFAVRVRLPGRIIATAVSSSDLDSPLLLFEVAELSQGYAEYQRARTEFARARRIVERLRALAANGAAAGKDVDDAEVDLLQAESHVRETEARLRESGIDPALLAQLRPGTALVAADLPESRVGLVARGQRAEVDLTSFPDAPQQGTVVAVSDAIDPQTRTARVSVLVKQVQAARPGMFASVQVTQSAVDATAIPRVATLHADARTYVFVRRSPTLIERREVLLGPDDGAMVAVLRGLAVGEAVITTNVILLKGLSFGY